MEAIIQTTCDVAALALAVMRTETLASGEIYRVQRQLLAEACASPLRAAITCDKLLDALFPATAAAGAASSGGDGFQLRVPPSLLQVNRKAPLKKSGGLPTAATGSLAPAVAPATPASKEASDGSDGGASLSLCVLQTLTMCTPLLRARVNLIVCERLCPH